MADELSALALRAQWLLGQGQIAEGIQVLRELIAQSPDYPGAQALLSRAVFPGAHYREVLKAIHSRLHPQTYLEIGVESGATLAFAADCEIAVGIDPEPLETVNALPPQLKVFRETSDAFFSSRDRASILGERPLDLVFIDGLHLFEQTLRDFIHVEAWSNPNTVVLLHDCLPVCEAAAARQRISKFWVGDVWKALEILREVRPDLRITVIPTPPSGLVVVRGLDAASRVLSETMSQLVASFAERAYPHPYGNWQGVYPLVENSIAGIDQALR
jgi:hypothetical protein